MKRWHDAQSSFETRLSRFLFPSTLPYLGARHLALIHVFVCCLLCVAVAMHHRPPKVWRPNSRMSPRPKTTAAPSLPPPPPAPAPAPSSQRRVGRNPPNPRAGGKQTRSPANGRTPGPWTLAQLPPKLPADRMPDPRGGAEGVAGRRVGEGERSRPSLLVLKPRLLLLLCGPRRESGRARTRPRRQRRRRRRRRLRSGRKGNCRTCRRACGKARGARRCVRAT